MVIPSIQVITDNNYIYIVSGHWYFESLNTNGHSFNTVITDNNYIYIVSGHWYFESLNTNGHSFNTSDYC